MSYGVGPSGFVKKPLDVGIDELQGDLREAYGDGVLLGSDDPLGQANLIIYGEVDDLWDLGEAVYQQFSPDTAFGVGLDLVSALTGALRLQARRTEVVVDCGGTNGTLLEEGRVVAVAGTEIFLQSKEAATIDAAGDGNPVAVTFEALNFGPVAVLPATVTEIKTPVSGWTTATNPLGHSILGRDLESDADFRLRRASLLISTGSGTVEAIAAHLAKLLDVTSVTVFQNKTDFTVDGIPPHAIEAVVLGGLDATVAQGVFEKVAAGIETHGTEGPFPIVDSQGQTQQIDFTRPTEIDIYVEVDVDVDAANYPADGDTQIEVALVAYGDGFAVKQDVVRSLIFGVVPLFGGGVVDITRIQIGTTAVVGDANIVITGRELAKFDATRIVVVSTPV